MPVTRGGRRVARHPRRITHVLPFRHNALMVFQGLDSCPLPPLYNFTIYFTHPDVNPDNVQPYELFKAIRKDSLLENFCHFRLELFFLHVPNAEDSDEACIAHYREEKRSRGDYTRQVETLGLSSTMDSENGAGSLPGLVPSYIEDPDTEYYHGLIYIYRGPDWTIDEQFVRRIFFDPIPQNVYSSFDHDADEPDILPAIAIFPLTIRHLENHNVKSIGEDMYFKSFLATNNVTNEPWEEAIRLEWSTW
ncbi:uncharacterized protein J4E78_010306 [Alternaria triticimaculans]|uniref:uncharacterized protein n=1 Tax=Alternaria triticimaculans TaxID=297637 RepID=UPI0020C27BD0|nr:uncharacterized protein J4E78_010306 [Alternaria triticimaculans]KAI4642005.1 hypothetical protein J4E78_010306 [Alternaria triticimaculans]